MQQSRVRSNKSLKSLENRIDVTDKNLNTPLTELAEKGLLSVFVTVTVK